MGENQVLQRYRNFSWTNTVTDTSKNPWKNKKALYRNAEYSTIIFLEFDGSWTLAEDLVVKNCYS